MKATLVMYTFIYTILVVLIYNTNFHFYLPTSKQKQGIWNNIGNGSSELRYYIVNFGF